MNYKAGFVGLIGLPNAGKSTLVNSIIKEKISIVSSKPQTTRRRVMGVYTNDNAQIVFVDAPGVVGPTTSLNQFLNEEYRAVITDSDVLVAVLNIDIDSQEKIQKIIDLVAKQNKPWMAVITKTDLAEKHRILMTREMLSGRNVDIVETSIKNPKDWHENLILALAKLLPESAPLYDSEYYTLSTEKEMTQEIVREKCFELLHQEIPYGLAVQVRKFEEGKTITKIYADIIVDKDSHKKVVIGKAGEKLKSIGQESRKDIEKLLQTKVYLELHVAVKKDWADKKQLMKELGYVVSKDE